MFNSSSEATHAYPVYISNGLVPDEVGVLTVAAMLPPYSDTRHPQLTPDQQAMNKCLLVWQAMTILLEDFINLSPVEEDADSFLKIGVHQLDEGEDAVAVYAVPFLWLGGMSLRCVCTV